MTASADELGRVHAQLTQVYLALVTPREEPLFSKDGAPLLGADGEQLTRTVYPTAAELAAANTFLKNNNITAVVGDTGALDDLAARLQAKRQQARANRPALADPYAELPAGFGGLQ